jgi:phage baseplate assembly protein W
MATENIVSYSDVNLDWIPHPLTGNINPITNIESIRQSIKILFLLSPYDIPFVSHTFTNLNKYLFENINHLTISNIVKRIEWTIKTYEKRVKLLDVKIVPLLSEDGIEITVTYKILALNLEDTFSQPFYRVR